jgi:hypothetical protein
MSFQVIERTFANTAQRGSSLAALFFLADRADDSGVSWYGVKKIAETINLSQRQTRHILSTLRERGEIWYAPRFFADGSQTSNGYLVCCGLSLCDVHAALCHPELQLSDEEIEAAVCEIATARGEWATEDGWGGYWRVSKRTSTDSGRWPARRRSLCGRAGYTAAAARHAGRD